MLGLSMIIVKVKTTIVAMMMMIVKRKTIIVAMMKMKLLKNQPYMWEEKYILRQF